MTSLREKFGEAHSSVIIGYSSSNVDKVRKTKHPDWTIHPHSDVVGMIYDKINQSALDLLCELAIIS